MTETVLVTGGTGFVGGWAIVRLLERGYRVRATVRNAVKEPAVRRAVASETEIGDRLTVVVAELSSDNGWDAAVAGCDYVLHIASPLSTAEGASVESLIGPARDGTLRVLRAATKAGVKRVVVTSSTAACTPSNAATVADESIWTDPDDPNTNGYRLSKVIAERAAWDFIASADTATTLTTILPGAIFGPVLATDNLGSVQFVQRLLQGAMPAVPKVSMQIVDVRDLADIHVAAMIAPEAAGHRFIAADDRVTMPEIAATLRQRLGGRAAKVPKRAMPDFVVHLLARFVPAMKMLLPLLGERPVFTSAKAKRLLGYAPRAASDTIVDCAESLLARA